MQPAILRAPPDSLTPSVPDADTAALLAFLSARDATCPSCKYNLRALTIPRCPECGGLLRLTVGLVDVPIGAWICAIAAILPAAPFGLLIGIACLAKGTSPLREIEQAEPWYLFLLMYSIFAVPAAIGLLAFRRAYMRLPRTAQGCFAAITILIDVAALITLLSLL